MSRHLRPSVAVAVALGVVVVAAMVAGCGTSVTTASPTAASTTAAPSPSGTPVPSVTPIAAASPTATPTAVPTPALPHVDAALEDTLPSTIGGVTLGKWSTLLSSYIAASTGGDKTLYVPWLVKFGQTPDQIDMAISTDASTVVVEAIKVPGATPAMLASSFGDVAKTAGWPVTSGKIADKSVLKIVDPLAGAVGTFSTAYVYAKGDVLYLVITDDATILAEALLKLP